MVTRVWSVAFAVVKAAAMARAVRVASVILWVSTRMRSTDPGTRMSEPSEETTLARCALIAWSSRCWLAPSLGWSTVGCHRMTHWSLILLRVMVVS